MNCEEDMLNMNLYLSQQNYQGIRLRFSNSWEITAPVGAELLADKHGASLLVYKQKEHI